MKVITYDELPEMDKRIWSKIEATDLTQDVKDKLKGKLLRKKVNNGLFPSCKCSKDFQSGIVLDPFAGSGSTLSCAKKLGFRYVGVEMNKEYIKIANEQLESML